MEQLRPAKLIAATEIYDATRERRQDTANTPLNMKKLNSVKHQSTGILSTGRTIVSKLGAFALLLLLGSLAWAADITGQVTDPSGASIFQARVSLVKAAGIKMLTAQTDEWGRFTLHGLPPGKYVVYVENYAFEPATVNVAITEESSQPSLIICLKLKKVSANVNVTGRPGTLTIPDTAMAQENLNKIPGDVSLISSDHYRTNAILSMSDALTLTPGVFAQEKEGTEEVRLSIRGSGINVPFGLRGILVLQDGIPVSDANGYSNPEVADVLNTDYIEVFRGANGLEYGSSTLGGAINFVTSTGHSQPGLDLRTEFGSFGYRRGQLRYGTVTKDGRLDAFFAVSGMYTDGFRQSSKESSYRFSGNIGYRFTPKSEGRLFITFERLDERRPGAISLGQLERNPFQAATGAVLTNAQIDLKPAAQVAYRHTLLFSDSDKLSFYGQYLDIQFNNPTTFARYSGPEHNFAGGMRQENILKLLGHTNRFVWGVDEARYWDIENTNGPVYYGTYVAEPKTGILQLTHDRDGLSDFFAQDSYSLTSTLTAVVGFQFAYAQRDLVSTTPTPPTYYSIFFPNSASRNYTGLNPKIGVLWAPRQKVQIFANVSRSFEPPDEYEFSPGSNLSNLDAQRATTAELGARGDNRALSWNFATYYSWVDKEIFSIQSPPNSGNWITFNRDHTRHAGIEAGLHSRSPIKLPRGSLTWNLAYTWSDFRFFRDPQFGDNRLPIVPSQFTRLDLAWHHSSGFYIGPKLDVASSLFVDLANTLRAPGYGVIGATVGYTHENRYRIFLDLRNLGNKYYAASTEYVVNAAGKDTPAFNPGITRSVFGGIEIKIW